MNSEFEHNSGVVEPLAAPSEGSSAVLTEIPRYAHFAPGAPATMSMRIPLLNVALFFVTLLTTTMAGAYMAGADLAISSPLKSAAALLAGLPFSIPLMAILLAHEMGHYVTAQRNRVDVTPPYFIPAPFPSIFLVGTFGAFIRIRSMPRSRRVMFDIGAAGPWAGMLVALPALIIGLMLSKVGPLDKSSAGLELGNSILFLEVARWVLHVDPNLVSVDLHPIAFAGWLGLFVTTLNLLPVGQLDGGHVSYALFGHHHRTISRLFVLGIILLVVVAFIFGMDFWAGWLFWAVLLFAFGLGHPVTADVDTPLDPMRRFAAWATLALFIVTFCPVPLSFNSAQTPDQEQEQKTYNVTHHQPHLMTPSGPLRMPI